MFVLAWLIILVLFRPMNELAHRMKRIARRYQDADGKTMSV